MDIDDFVFSPIEDTDLLHLDVNQGDNRPLPQSITSQVIKVGEVSPYLKRPVVLFIIFFFQYFIYLFIYMQYMQ